MKYVLEGDEAWEVIFEGLRKQFGSVIDAEMVGAGKEARLRAKLNSKEGIIHITWWVEDKKC